MTDQQIEIWRKEFFALINEKLSYQNYPESDLIEFHLDGELIASYNHPAEIDPNHSCEDIKKILWHSFLMAKRTQPVIELPTPFNDSISGYECDELHNAITAAGYQYKVKE